MSKIIAIAEIHPMCCSKPDGGDCSECEYFGGIKFKDCIECDYYEEENDVDSKR